MVIVHVKLASVCMQHCYACEDACSLFTMLFVYFLIQTLDHLLCKNTVDLKCRMLGRLIFFLGMPDSHFLLMSFILSERNEMGIDL